MDLSDEKRDAQRQAVLKTAKIEWGSSVVDCLVLEQSIIGMRVSMSIPMEVPEQVTIRLHGGAVRPATRRWARGTEIGFEFGGIARLDAVAANHAVDILVKVRAMGLDEIMTSLSEARFFDDAELGSVALAAQAAMRRLEAALRQRVEGGRK
jgi:hypothetical protein